MALSLEEADNVIEVRRRLATLKLDICKQCKKNFELEKELRFFDQKIALLINHRISVEEFPDSISFGEHRLGAIKDDLQRQNFGNLLFLLQTEPRYLAKLTRIVSPSEIDELLKTVMFSLYGNQYEAREEHLLLKMFELSLNMEFQETEEFNSLMRVNTAISRMMTTYTRRGPGQEYLKSTLGPLIEELAASDVSLELNPSQIYCEVYEMSEDGSVLLEEAQQDPKVIEVGVQRAKLLEEVSCKFLDTVIASLPSVPYGIKWLCKAIRYLCKDKFPEVPDENIACMVGGFFMLRFINAAIVSPHAYILLTVQPNQTLRRNLVLIAKILQAISNKPTNKALKEPYMQPLEDFVNRRRMCLQTFLSRLCDVEDFHSYLEIEQFLSLSKDMTVTMAIKEVYTLYAQLSKYKEDLVVGENDKLIVVLSDLAAVMSIESVQDDETVVQINLVSRWNKAPEVMECGEMEMHQDQVQSLRSRCRKIIMKLFLSEPCLMQAEDMTTLIAAAATHEDDEIGRLGQLAFSHLDALKEIDRQYDDLEFLDAIKQRVIEQEMQYDRIMNEIHSLQKVYETLCWHGDFLCSQLEAYKEYLTAVRNKAAMRETRNRNKPSTSTKTVIGPLKFSYTQLEKDGVILESRAIPDKRKGNIYLTILSPEPGIYKIQLKYKFLLPGQVTRLELDLHLEDLLELQHFRDPVLSLNDVVLLDVRRTILFLRKHFSTQ